MSGGRNLKLTNKKKPATFKSGKQELDAATPKRGKGRPRKHGTKTSGAISTTDVIS